MCRGRWSELLEALLSPFLLSERIKNEKCSHGEGVCVCWGRANGLEELDLCAGLTINQSQLSDIHKSNMVDYWVFGIGPVLQDRFSCVSDVPKLHVNFMSEAGSSKPCQGVL